MSLGTIATALAVCLMAFFAAKSVWKNRKAGGCSSCGCGCSGCQPGRGVKEREKEAQKEA